MANLLLLGAGSHQIPAIEEAHKLGFNVAALDGNPNALGFALADWHEQIDIKNLEAVVRWAKHFNALNILNGVMTLGVECAPSVGAVADELKLPGIGRATAVDMTYKNSRHLRLEDHVFLPKKRTLIPGAKWEGSYPCVVKKLEAGSAAEDVFFVRNEAELESHRDEFNMVPSVEEYIDGPELSTESIVYSADNHIDFIVDRNYSRKAQFHPFMIEDGCSMPSKISHEMRLKVQHTIGRIIERFNLKNCILKCDLVLNGGNVYVLECVPRLSGGQMCSHIIQPCTGYNLVRIAIGFAMGEHRYTPGPHIETPVAQRYYFPPGKEIKSHRDRGKAFMAHGRTVDEAISNAEALVERYAAGLNPEDPNQSPYKL